ncbi:uncharacterized protein PHACADRAFT_32789 [Phanerochaete carnosa HHB-10118-sp]|uniref:Uncharacterized protein n=1 Tax=Phanerochaete carnosa (strain HHB-10118-sp) TaxID=650164 RepID=K5WI66_PHACS|nr:uncharacterized protein PHACADRAFT_32789 [Phanerochaete carnosa HHB-10118-sp]EKM49917.1 hypothetical protein PHACADRAFT_32789 [Phanerochaete carnosa HHB-10118-sp]
MASTGASTMLMPMSYAKRRIAPTPPLHVDAEHVDSQGSASGNQTGNRNSSSFIFEFTATTGSASDAELVDLHLSISCRRAPSVYEAALPQIKEEDSENRRSLHEARRQRDWELSQVWDVFQEQISDAGGMVEEVTTEFEDFFSETRNKLNRYHAKFAKAVKGSKHSLDVFGKTLKDSGQNGQWRVSRRSCPSHRGEGARQAASLPDQKSCG